MTRTMSNARHRTYRVDYLRCGAAGRIPLGSGGVQSRIEPVVVCQPCLAPTRMVVGEQSIELGVVGLIAEGHSGPEDSLVRSAMIHHPSGRLLPQRDVPWIGHQTLLDLSHPSVF